MNWFAVISNLRPPYKSIFGQVTLTHRNNNGGQSRDKNEKKNLHVFPTKVLLL